MFCIINKKDKEILDLNNPEKELIHILTDRLIFVDKDLYITIKYEFNVVSEITFKHENGNLSRYSYVRKSKK